MGEKEMSSYSILRAEFIYKDNLSTHPLTAGYVTVQPEVDRGLTEVDRGLTSIAVDVAAGLAAKAAESLIDAAALRMQPEAATLDITIPLDGFYDATGRIAVDQGCLVFHDGDNAKGSNRSILAVFQLNVSPDGTAFRFTVARWEHEVFLQQVRGWFQKAGERDFAIKIEMLAPGSDGLGTRAVFVEHVFTSVEQHELAALFTKGQKLPWFAMPRRPATEATGARPGAAAVRTMPLNLRVTLVETTKPNQFAVWLQALAKEKKGEVASLVKDAVRQAIDPGFAASQGAKQADAAGTAYTAYKTTWDDLIAHKADKPKMPDQPTGEQTAGHDAALAAWTAKFTVKAQALDAKKLVAKVAFDAADLPWPGNLPEIKAL